jgi:hypothetical protein
MPVMAFLKTLTDMLRKTISRSVVWRIKMRHGSGVRSKEQEAAREVDHRFDRRSHMFANSAYRNAKQRGFLTGSDVLNSIESDEDFIKRLNMPSFASLAKLGKL